MPRSLCRRLLTALLLLAFVLLASGCVYLRLLALKNQLREFDRNFVLQTNDGLRVICQNPVLHPDDLRWLGVEPKTIQRNAGREAWHVRWVKEPPAGASEMLEHDVVLNAEFEDRRLRAIQIPEKYFEYISKTLFVNLLRSTGGAKIDKSERRADVTTPTEATPAGAVAPTLASIDQMLGAPTTQAVEADFIRYMYRYRPETRSAKARPIEMTFTFDAADGRLRRLSGKLPKGSVNIVFAAPTLAAPEPAKTAL